MASDEKCLFHELHEKKLDDFDKRINDLETKTALDTQRFTMILENLSELPGAIKCMERSMCSMQREIETSNKKTDSMKEQLEKINAKVNQIDNEGKYNIRQFASNNFTQIVIGVAIISAVVTAWIGKLIGSIL